VDAAVKIIGNGRARRADIELVVDHMNKLCQRAKRTQSRESKSQKQFAKQYGAALRKVITMTNKASTDFRVVPLLYFSAPQPGIDKEIFDHEHFLHHLQVLARICERWEKSKLGKPKPSANEKQLAAKAALILLRKYNIDPTTTKTGIFCRLAAVLYGDKDADLQHHCRLALSRSVNPG